MGTEHSQFRSLRSRLLLSYLSIMAAILSSSAIAVYHLFADGLYAQLDNRLLLLGDAAAHSLASVKNHEQDEQKESSQDNDSETNKQSFRSSSEIELLMDRDGDLDISITDIQQLEQGIEWFDQHQILLNQQGKVFPASRQLNLRSLSEKRTVDGGKIRTVTLPVYHHDGTGQRLNLEGYVRVNESTDDVEAVLVNLRWGLGLGGVMALGLTAMSSQWLTRQAVHPVEQSFQKLKQFTADASHELRSPLTAIKTSVDVMQSHPERIHPADVKKLVAIASATNQMTRLVEDLLLLARMDASGSPKYDPTLREWRSIPLHELLEELLDCFEIQAEEEGITLKADLLPIGSVMGNSSQLMRLFSTLLQNALQYTLTGGKVDLSLGRHDHLAVVSIEDSGIGIAPDDLPLVFDRFWRADRARSQCSGGLGLGLAIAQRIAQQHGGEITVTSQVGVGSRFVVRLPLEG